MGIRPMGPCRVQVVKRDGASKTIDRTFGGVTWTEAEEKADIVFDQTGTVPADRMSQGFRNEVVVPIGISDLPLLAFFPGIELVTDSGDPTKTFIRRVSRLGLLDSEVLVELIITQFKSGVPSTDPEDRIIFPAAAPQVEGDKAFDAATQRAYPLRFFAYPDERRADRASWLMGDVTATPA
jgi:hypothetical protein